MSRRKQFLPVFFLSFLFFVPSSFCQSADKAIVLKPKIVFIDRNPWLMVIGSDSPSFALYENGLVIFRRINREKNTERISTEYVSATLSPKERDDFINSLPLRDLSSFNNHYETTHATDQATQLFYVWDQGKRKSVSIYGSDWNSPQAKQIPTPLIEMLKKISDFQMAKARPWTPSKMELILWPYSAPNVHAIPWPAGWPDLNSPQAKKRGEDSYSIFLDPSKFDELNQKIRNTHSSPTLQIDGKTWAASFRYPFPGEENWMK